MSQQDVLPPIHHYTCIHYVLQMQVSACSIAQWTYTICAEQTKPYVLHVHHHNNINENSEIQIVWQMLFVRELCNKSSSAMNIGTVCMCHYNKYDLVCPLTLGTNSRLIGISDDPIAWGHGWPSHQVSWLWDQNSLANGWPPTHVTPWGGLEHLLQTLAR